MHLRRKDDHCPISKYDPFAFRPLSPTHTTGSDGSYLQSHPSPRTPSSTAAWNSMLKTRTLTGYGARGMLRDNRTIRLLTLFLTLTQTQLNTMRIRISQKTESMICALKCQPAGSHRVSSTTMLLGLIKHKRYIAIIIRQHLRWCGYTHTNLNVTWPPRCQTHHSCLIMVLRLFYLWQACRMTMRMMPSAAGRTA